jgi:hypothetical protein
MQKRPRRTQNPTNEPNCAVHPLRKRAERTQPRKLTIAKSDERTQAPPPTDLKSDERTQARHPSHAYCANEPKLRRIVHRVPNLWNRGSVSGQPNATNGPKITSGPTAYRANEPKLDSPESGWQSANSLIFPVPIRRPETVA